MNLLDFKIIIVDKNNVVSSNYDGIDYRNELKLSISKDNYIDNPKIKGFVENLPIIIDSNYIGNIYFVSNSKFIENKDLLKLVRDIIIDLIN